MPFPVGGPATSAWREQVFSRAADYRFLARLLLSHATERDRQALQAIERQIDTAERAAAGRRGQPKARKGDNAKKGEPAEPSLGRFGHFLSVLSGAGVERANSQLDGVETDLLRLAPDPYLRGHLPTLVAHVRDHLSDRDPRRLQVERVAADVERGRASSRFRHSSAIRCSARFGRPAWRADRRSGGCGASATCCS